MELGIIDSMDVDVLLKRIQRAQYVRLTAVSTMRDVRGGGETAQSNTYVCTVSWCGLYT
jgi:hypothetical protein